MSDNRIVVPKDIWAMFTELCCVNEIAIVSMTSNTGLGIDVGYHRNVDEAYKIGANALCSYLLCAFNLQEAECRELYKFTYRLEDVKKIGNYPIPHTVKTNKDIYDTLAAYYRQRGWGTPRVNVVVRQIS